MISRFLLLLLSASMLRGAAPEPKKPETPQIRTDRHGDPLPKGALARLGTVRWRHGSWIKALAYSPDGKKIAAVGAGRAITLWDAATGKEIHQFPNRISPFAVAFSPDGKILAVTDWVDCRLWDVASGKELRQLKGRGDTLRSIAFAPDGKTLAAAGFNGTAHIWETSSGKELRRPDGKPGYFHFPVYSPDGKFLAAGGADGIIRLWDANARTERHQLKGHQRKIANIVFAAKGKYLASTSEDYTIRLWDLATGRQIRIIENKRGSLSTMAISPDGAVLAFLYRDGTVCLWDVASWKEKRRWRPGVSEDMWAAMAFSPDGKTFVTGWDGCIRLWDVATGQEKNPSDVHHGTIELLRFSAKEKTLLSMSSGDRCLLEWDLVSNTPRQLFSWSDGGYRPFALSPDGGTLALMGWGDLRLCLWKIGTGKPGVKLDTVKKSHLWQTAISPDGRLVAARSTEEHVIYLWDAVTGKEIHQFQGIGDEVAGLTFSPDSKMLACGNGGLGGTGKHIIRLWDVKSGKEVRSFTTIGPEDVLAFSPDGSVLATARGEGEWRGEFAGSVLLWDRATGKELGRHTGHRAAVCAVAFSPDGKLIASGTGLFGQKDISVHVWEAATGRLIRRFEGQHSSVRRVAFSPDGLTVASGAGDSTILLWDITGRRSDGRWHAKPLTPHELEAQWDTLANTDAAKAYDAVWVLVAAPEQAVPFLRKKMPPIARPDDKAVARWITDFDSDDFTVRDKATEELHKIGDAAALGLQRALDGKPAPEARHRIQQLLDRTRDWSPERLRYHRALQVLEHIGTRQAKEVLQSLAAGAPGVRRTEEAKTALQRMTRSSLPTKNP